MVDELIVDPKIKEAAKRASREKIASMAGVRAASDSSNKLLEEVLIYIAKHHGGKHGRK